VSPIGFKTWVGPLNINRQIYRLRDLSRSSEEDCWRSEEMAYDEGPMMVGSEDHRSFGG